MVQACAWWSFSKDVPCVVLIATILDTWNETSDDAKFMTVEELWDQYERNRQFYANGGITVTGGEALMQIDFVTELSHISVKETSIPV